MTLTNKKLVFGRLLGLAIGAALALGCQEDTEIRHYQVPRVEKKQPPWRLLGAIIPRADQVWFFRLEGPEKEIAELKGTFDQFVRSIRFTKSEQDPVKWVLPEGWRQLPGDKKFRFATLRITGKDGPLDMTVIPLPREGRADSILRNVIRWRDQLGLFPIPETELGQNAQTIEVQGVPMTVVDITGFHVPRRPMFAAGSPKPSSSPPAGRAPLTYDLPEGWKKAPAKGIRLATFVVEDRDQQAEVTIIPLGKQAGSLLDNVNRWRGEVDLKPTTEANLADEARPMTIAGAPAHYVDLVGPRQRTLAVMLARANSTWFFKMKGPAEVVGKHKPAFEEFVKSIKFTPGPGN